MRLGIDFGTTRTVVAAVDDGRHPIAAFDHGGEFRDYLPGIAALHGGKLVVGWEAARALPDATHAIRSIKRVATELLPDAPVPGLPGVTALALVTAFLTELRRAIVEASNLELELEIDGPLEAMVAVPASAASRQRWLTLEAFRRAGFSPIGLVNEPTAAAIEFAHRHLPLGKRSPKRYVVVYDLGGGTFDASAVSLEGRRFDLIASEGKKLQLAAQPFAATAVGLAIAADLDAHVMIREALTRHFRVWREAAAGTDKVFDPLISKNTPGRRADRRRAALPADACGRPPAVPRVRRARRGGPALIREHQPWRSSRSWRCRRPGHRPPRRRPHRAGRARTSASRRRR